MIDYKYSGAQNTKNLRPTRISCSLSSTSWPSNDSSQLRPKACRTEVSNAVWNASLGPFLPRNPSKRHLRVVGEIRARPSPAHPADPDKCRFCDYRDVCRFAAAAPALAEGVASWD